MSIKCPNCAEYLYVSTPTPEYGQASAYTNCPKCGFMVVVVLIVTAHRTEPE